jgi:MFS family permease
MAVDSIGTGLFLPFAVLYFLHTTALPLTLIGGGLTAAYLVALPTPVAVGPLLDRFGPRRVIAAGNLLSVLAFTGYIFVGSLWQLILAALVASVGQATFWTATRALVALIARPAERGSWFAMQTTIRNAGYGLGGILGAVAVSAGSRWAYLLLAAVNAASFLLAAALVLRWRPPAEGDPRTDRHDTPPSYQGTAGGTYRHLLRDRALVLVAGVNVAFVLCLSVLTVLLAVYITRVLGLPAWLAGALFTVNTVLVVIMQTATTRRVRGYRPERVLQAAAGCYAAAFLLFWALTITPHRLLVAVLLAAIVAFTVAEVLQGPTINALVVDIAPANASGRHMAAFQLSWSLSQAAAPLLLTWLLSRGPQWPWIALMAACALAITAAQRSARTRPRRLVEARRTADGVSVPSPQPLGQSPASWSSPWRRPLRPPQGLPQAVGSRKETPASDTH